MNGMTNTPASIPGWDEFFREIERFVSALDRYADTANAAFAEYALERLEVCITGVVRLATNLRSPPTDLHVTAEETSIVYAYFEELDGLVTHLRQLAVEWQHYLDCLNVQINSASYSVSVVQTRRPSGGRPKFDISRGQLEYLHSMSFDWTKISSMLGVSRSTIYRRRSELGLLHLTAESNISDDQLEVIIREIKRESPALGETLAMGRLRSIGIRVRRSRVRNCIRSIDPISTALRWKGQLARRQPYSVPGPNSLRHLGMLI